MYKAVGVCGTLAVPTFALFYFVGVCLWAFYQGGRHSEVAGLAPDGVFPHFIMHHLPPGEARVFLWFPSRAMDQCRV